MAYDIIRTAILNGTLVPGQKLRQNSLAETLGISRIPVRSALIQLEAEGLVEMHDRRGAVVKSLSADQAREIYDIRMHLEALAVRLSMKTMASRLDVLKERAAIADEMGEGPGFIEARSAFYQELFDAAHHPILWDVIEGLRMRVGRYVLNARVVDAHTHPHAALVTAVESGDEEVVIAALREHIERVRDAVIELVHTESS
jgi:DNA-binding GntR family transcriptional regulator